MRYLELLARGLAGTFFLLVALVALWAGHWLAIPYGIAAYTCYRM